jgi:hypothetical protein
MTYFFVGISILVPKRGLEPPQDCSHMNLNHARLPVPPLRQKKSISDRPKNTRNHHRIKIFLTDQQFGLLNPPLSKKSPRTETCCASLLSFTIAVSCSVVKLENAAIIR